MRRGAQVPVAAGAVDVTMVVGVPVASLEAEMVAVAPLEGAGAPPQPN